MFNYENFSSQFKLQTSRQKYVEAQMLQSKFLSLDKAKREEILKFHPRLTPDLWIELFEIMAHNDNENGSFLLDEDLNLFVKEYIIYDETATDEEAERAELIKIIFSNQKINAQLIMSDTLL